MCCFAFLGQKEEEEDGEQTTAALELGAIRTFERVWRFESDRGTRENRTGVRGKDQIICKKSICLFLLAIFNGGFEEIFKHSFSICSKVKICSQRFTVRLQEGKIRLEF